MVTAVDLSSRPRPCRWRSSAIIAWRDNAAGVLAVRAHQPLCKPTTYLRTALSIRRPATHLKGADDRLYEWWCRAADRERPVLPQQITSSYFQLSINTLRLTLEAQALIGLRLFRIATGAVPALAECSRMVPEKGAALVEAQRIVALGAATGRSASVPAKVVRLYRGRVRANKKRHSKKG